MYKDGIIYIEGDKKGNVNENVYRHEVFHKIFDKFLTTRERELLIDLAKGAYGDLPLSELSERLAQSFQTYRIPLISRFLKTTIKDLESLDNMFRYIDENFLGSPYDKMMGSRPTLDILRNFDTPELADPMRLFLACEQTLFDTLTAMLNPPPNGRIYSLDEALVEIFPIMAKDLDKISKDLASVTVDSERAKLEDRSFILGAILKNKEGILAHYFRGWDQSKIRAKDKLKRVENRLSSILRSSEHSDEEKEAEELKYQTLKAETEESLSRDPETGLTARIKYALGTLTYKSSRGDYTPIPFKTSFAILTKLLNQADLRSPQALVGHIQKKFSKYQSFDKRPPTPEGAILGYLRDLTDSLDIEPRTFTFKRNTRYASLWVDASNKTLQQQSGEKLNDFVNRVAKELNVPRSKVIDAYKFFDAKVTLSNIATQIGSLAPYKMWMSEDKYDEKTRTIPRKLFRNKTPGAQTIERGNIEEAVLRFHNQKIRPFSPIDELTGGPIQVTSNFIDDATAKKLVDAFIKQTTKVEAGYVISPPEYRKLADKLRSIDRAYHDALTEDELVELSNSFVREIADILTGFSSAAQSFSMRTADKSSRYSYTDSTYQRTILNTLANFYDKGVNGILPPDLTWDKTGKFIEGVSPFMQKSLLVGRSPVYAIKDFLDWDAQIMNGNRKPVEYIDESTAQWWDRTYVTGFITSLASKGKQAAQFLPIPSNRKNIQGVFYTPLSVARIKSEILPRLLEAQRSRPDLPIGGYSKDRLTLPTIGSLNVHEASVEDIIKAIDLEVAKTRQAILSSEPKAYDYLRLSADVAKIAKDTGLFTFSAKSVTIKKSFDSEARKILEDRLLEEGYAKEDIESALRSEPLSTEIEELAENLKLQYEDRDDEGKSQKISDTRDLINEALVAPLEVFVYNYVVLQHELTSLLYADPAMFKNNAALVKRIQGATSSGKTPLIMPQYGGLPEKSSVLALDDVEIPFDEVFDKALTLPASNPVRQMLQEITAGDALNEVDAAGFSLPEYEAQLSESYSAELAVDVVQKLMYFSKDPKGALRFIKYSSVTLTNELCETFPQLGKLRQAMREHNAKGVGAPIGFAVFKSGIKIGFPETRLNVDNLDAPLVIDPAHTFEIDNRMMRMPLNPASSALGTTQIPTQINYLLNANHLNTEELDVIYRALEVIFDMGRKLIFKDIELSSKGKPTRMTQTKLRNLVIEANADLVGREFETSLLSAADDYGFSVSNSVPLLADPIRRTLMAKLSRATVNSRIRGSKLVLAPEFGTRKKFNFDTGKAESRYLRYKDEEGYTEVIMPDTFKGRFTEGEILGFRIPSTHLHSFVALKVVGFYPAPAGADANIVIAPSIIQFASGSD